MRILSHRGVAGKALDKCVSKSTDPKNKVVMVQVSRECTASRQTNCAGRDTLKTETDRETDRQSDLNAFQMN